MNISDVKRRSINVVWAHYSPDHPYQLVIYAVVCTPTSGKAGSTVFNVNKYNDRADVGRLHTGTNYTVEIVALVNNNQTGEVSLRKSQKVYVTTVEGGKNHLIVIRTDEKQHFNIPPTPTPPQSHTSPFLRILGKDCKPHFQNKLRI